MIPYLGRILTIRWQVLILAFSFSHLLLAQAIGDFGTVAAGTWSTPGIWGQWNGSAFTGSPGVPLSNAKAYVNHDVVLSGSGPYSIGDLVVTSTGRLWTSDNPTNVYMYIYGSTLQCDGQIGDNVLFDGISFGIEGANVTISGTGVFDASRIRKNTAVPNAVTNLVIARNIDLHFTGGSTTQIYNSGNAACVFNVTVNAGATVNLIGASGGNVAMDGVTGVHVNELGGAYVINGNLNISGTLYLTCQNSTAGYGCSFTIGPTGYVRTRAVDCSASLSAVAGHALTINAGGTLEVFGTPNAFTAFSTTNNTFSLSATSLFYYSGLGPQTIETGITGGYGRLRVGGTGTKPLNGTLTVRSDLDITNALGTPILDVTTSNFQINVAGNWTSYGASAFTERTGTVAFNGTIGQAVNTTGGEVFYNLRLSKLVNTVVTFNSNVDVSNQLNFFSGGLIDLNGNRMSILNPATTGIIGGTSARYILSERTDNSSRVLWRINTTAGAHLIPFGRSGGNFLPFTFNLTSGNAGDITVATYGTIPANTPWPTTPTAVTNLNSTTGLLPDNRDATVDRFWQLDVTGTPVATLTFTYAAAELPLSPYNTPTAMVAQRWNSGTSRWEPPAPGQTSTTYNATVGNVTQFGPWALAASLSPLPINLLSFTASAECGKVDLAWITASEKDNDHFTVLRSLDGENFTAIADVPGSGSTAHIRSYAATDQVTIAGLVYYRLDQTDIDGSTATSGIAVVRTTPCDQPLIMVYPNPCSDELHVSAITGTAQLELFDAKGQRVQVPVIQRSSAGADLDVRALPGGHYVLRATDPMVASSTSVVIQH